MKIFVSALPTARYPMIDGGRRTVVDRLLERGIRMRYNLLSYYAIKGAERFAAQVRDNSDEMIIDSGAHSFQKGKTVRWDDYTADYADFIRRFDRPNVIGYFEMDVDYLGMAAVLAMRRKLETVTDKIIPVWHKGRGIDDYLRMCEAYSGRIVAVSGFANQDIKDEQYLSFLKVAREHGCKMHCLGMTRRAVLDKVPFDYVDSSSWLQMILYGKLPMRDKSRSIDRAYHRRYSGELITEAYIDAMKMQNEYEMKWRKELV